MGEDATTLLVGVLVGAATGLYAASTRVTVATWRQRLRVALVGAVVGLAFGLVFALSA